MQELEKILEEIDLLKEDIVNICCGDDYNAGIRDMAMMAKQIIHKHRNDGWIPVGERMPENAKHKGVYRMVRIVDREAKRKTIYHKFTDWTNRKLVLMKY